MIGYKIKIDPDALLDIQEATDWYNSQLHGLGSRFQKRVKQQINALKANPENQSIRYADVRCILIKRFPFLIHYTVENSVMTVKNFCCYSHKPQSKHLGREKKKELNSL